MMGCSGCGFQLFNYLGRTRTAQVGLYDDGRFPGRLIVLLSAHHEHLDQVPEELAADYIHDLQKISRALRRATGSPRINLSILGNTEPHVHAHLVPRYPELEENPGRSPWNDPRELYSLHDRESLMELLKSELPLLR